MRQRTMDGREKDNGACPRSGKDRDDCPWAEPFAGHAFERILAPGAIEAAVMIPLVQDRESGEWGVLFELRSSGIVQGGEVCFPGGRVEAGEDPEETVVRECAEELLVPEGRVEVTAPLFRMMGPAGAEISCYLGILRDYEDTFSQEEVETVFRIPVRALLAMEPQVHEGVYEADPGEGFPYHLIRGGREYPWRGIRKRYFFYETEHEVIWGMTAELLYHYLEKLRGRPHQP